MDVSRESKKKLRPMLERVVNDRSFPGVVWDPRMECAFRIPWGHYNKTEDIHDEFKIFKEWAVVTGKYQEGGVLEYPKWKTQLRCALRKTPDVEEVPALHSKPEDLHQFRVYKFVDVVVKKNGVASSSFADSPSRTASASSSPLSGRDFLPDSVFPPNRCEEYHRDTPQNFLNVSNPLPNVPTVVQEHEGFFEHKNYVEAYENMNQISGNVESDNRLKAQDKSFDSLLCGSAGAAQIVPTMDNFLDSPMTDEATHSFPPSVEGQNEAEMLSFLDSEKNVSLPSDLHSLDKVSLVPPLNSTDMPSMPSLDTPDTSFQLGASAAAATHHESKPPKAQTTLLDETSADRTDSLILKMFYAPKQQVGDERIGPEGCRLFYGKRTLQNTIVEEDMFGPKGCAEIELPGASEARYADETQKKNIAAILKMMKRGVVLTFKHGDIYAQRKCKTRVNVWNGRQGIRSWPLDRTKTDPEKVFDFVKFRQDLEAVNSASKNSGATGASLSFPVPYFYLILGQEVSDIMSPDPLNGTLIHICVCHSRAEKLLRKTNCSSFDSFASFSNSLDKMLTLFESNSIQDEDMRSLGETQ